MDVRPLLAVLLAEGWSLWLRALHQQLFLWRLSLRPYGLYFRAARRAVGAAAQSAPGLLRRHRAGDVRAGGGGLSLRCRCSGWAHYRHGLRLGHACAVTFAS